MERKSGSGSAAGPRDKDLAQKVKRAMKVNPARSLRFIAKKFGVPVSYVFRVKKNTGLKSFVVKKVPRRVDKNVKRAKSRARKMYDRFLLDDESYVSGL